MSSSDINKEAVIDSTINVDIMKDQFGLDKDADFMVIDDSEIHDNNYQNLLFKLKNLQMYNKLLQGECNDLMRQSKECEAENAKFSEVFDYDSLILTDNEDFSTTDSESDSEETIFNDRKINKDDQPEVGRMGLWNESSVNSSESLKDKKWYIWVCNLPRHTSAFSLRQYLEKYCDVEEIEIVTDGEGYYGYVTFANHVEAERCMRTVDGTTFEYRQLRLAFTTPSDYDNIKRQMKLVVVPSPQSAALRKAHEDEFDRKYLLGKRRIQRLKHILSKQEQKNRKERQRQWQMSEQQREMEWKLKVERKQLEIERVKYEQEKKDLIELYEMRRNIEKERLTIMKEKARMKHALRQSALERREAREEYDQNQRQVNSRVYNNSYDSNRNNRWYKHNFENFSSAAPAFRARRNYGYHANIMHRRNDDSTRRRGRNYISHNRKPVHYLRRNSDGFPPKKQEWNVRNSNPRAPCKKFMTRKHGYSRRYNDHSGDGYSGLSHRYYSRPHGDYLPRYHGYKSYPNRKY